MCSSDLIMDADKEGFLRSERSLTQTVGRAARNVNGRVIMYADVVTQSMQKTIDETERRRSIQEEYNQKHGITPKSVSRPIQKSLRTEKEEDHEELMVSESNSPKEIKKLIKQLEKEMFDSVKKLEFEKAALLRDQINFLKDGTMPSKNKKAPKKYGRKKR